MAKRARTSSSASPRKSRSAGAGGGASKSPEAGAAVAAPARGGRGGGGGGGGREFDNSAAIARVKDRQLVIVESPSKAKTINKYLGADYVVLASVGHVRDLPAKNPKGVKGPVPGVDLEHDFAPSYQILPAKTKTISDLKRAAKNAREVWFATDLDREGEAIAWHLADELGIAPAQAKRVKFAAITKDEIGRAFAKPSPIDMDRVYAQQARRLVDRIVGYQVSPLLWKKVARGLSAGRVQSVAVRLVVEREREIRAFVPEELWSISAAFAIEPQQAAKFGPAFAKYLATPDEKGNPPSQKGRSMWLSEAGTLQAELVEINGQKFDISCPGAKPVDLIPRVREAAALAGLTITGVEQREDPKGRGPAAVVKTVRGTVDPSAKYRVSSVETKRVSVRPAPPFITSTLQQAASTRLGFGARRTMQAAQALYEGVDVPGEGPVGLITYMRTDSTHLSGQAIQMARDYIQSKFGDKYLPEKPNFFSSSNKDAQEAHEAIRPTSLNLPPSKVRAALREDQFRLYQLIWDRFVACQMESAEWDSTTVLITGGTRPNACTFKATGRTLVFDGFYKVTGVPPAADVATMPAVSPEQPTYPFWMSAEQRFGSPPARYSEASLIKVLESEGIGRPSTYASIIQVIQDRKYVEQIDRRMYATDLGEVVTDKLVEAFPKIMDVGYTRDMETELDKIEEDHLDWVDMLHRFYSPFKHALENAHETMTHAKAETTPAPADLTCPLCAREGRGDKVPLVYRFGKNGRFLSCSKYPECAYACPVDREGRPRPAEHVDVACVKCGGPMIKRTGRFGPFLGCMRYNDEKHPEGPCDGILNIDKKGHVVAPSQPPLVTDLPCPKCQSPMNLRQGIRGPWLGCSRFPKCRGRGKWADVPEAAQKKLETDLAAHDKANPVPIVRTLEGKPLTDSKGKPLPDAPTVDKLSQGEALQGSSAPAAESVEADAA